MEESSARQSGQPRERDAKRLRPPQPSPASGSKSARECDDRVKAQSCADGTGIEWVRVGTEVPDPRQHEECAESDVVGGTDRIAAIERPSGCVDPALYERALSIARSGRSPDLLRFGSSDDVFEVSLSCGGVVDVFVQRVEDRFVWREVLAAVRADRPTTIATAMAVARVGRDHLADGAYAA